LEFFGKKVAPQVVPWSDYWHGEDVPGPHSHTKCHHCSFRNVCLSPPKLSKYAIFGINQPLWGMIGLKRFLQNLTWGGSPRSVPSCQISPLWFKKWVDSTRNRQNW